MEDDPLVGAIVADRYRVDAVIGRGGMGAVYRAHDALVGAPVALKVVLPGDDAPRFIPRIMREARLAARLHHPNVVPVLDHGRWGHERRHVYLTMELIEGATLAQWIGEPMDPAPACELASQLLLGLAHVHARGVLHRDIKPENVLVSRESDRRLRARLADFGIAAAMEDESPDLTRLTREGSVLGTPLYMAPEQIEARSRLGPGVDLYAVGLILYELLTGEAPFSGPLARMLYQKLHETPPAPSVPLPDGLGGVLMRLIARRPEDRFVLAADAHAALARFGAPAIVEDARWEAMLGRSTSRVPSSAATASATAASRAARSDGLWGREAEGAAIEGWASQVERGDGLVALVLGDTGMGKSALLEASAIALNEAGRFVVLRGRRPPGGDATAALAAALEDWLGTRGRDSDAVEAALRASGCAGRDTDAAELLTLLRPDEASAPLESGRARAAFVGTLRRIAGARPAMVLLEDLEPDASVAALVELLLYELELEPFPCLVAIPLRRLRPEDPLHASLSRTAAAEGRGRRMIELGPLPLDSLAEMLERAHGLPPHRAATVAKRAGGNPLFAIQLAGFEVMDSSDALAATARQDGGALPPALRGLLEASLSERLAELGEGAAPRILERAAILGDQVELALLEELVDEADRERIDEHLDALIGAELLVDAGVDAVAFAHRLLREVVLARLTPRRLRRLHAHAALIREERGRAEEEGPIGDHLAAAGKPEAAAEAWLRAQRRALERGQTDIVIERGMQALAALPEDDPRRAAVALDVGWALRRAARLDEAAALAAPLVEGPDADDALCATELLVDLAQEAYRIGEMGRLVESVRPRLAEATNRGRAAFLRAAAFATNVGVMEGDGLEVARQALELSTDPVARLTAARRVVFAGGQRAPEVARIVLEVAREVEASSPALRLDAGLLRARAEFLLLGGNDASIEHLRQLVDDLRRAGRMAERVAATVDLGGQLLMVGRFEEAYERAEEAHALAGRFGLAMELGRSLGSLVVLEVLLGRPERARARLAEVALPTDGARTRHPFGLFLTMAAAACGDGDTARRALSEIDPSRVPHIPYFSGVLYHASGCLRDAGLYADARRLAELARDRERASGRSNLERKLATRLAEIDAEIGLRGTPS